MRGGAYIRERIPIARSRAYAASTRSAVMATQGHGLESWDMRQIVVVIAAMSIVGVGCSGSSTDTRTATTTTRPTAQGSAAALCSIPSATQLAALLGSSQTRRTPIPDTAKTDATRAIACQLTAKGERLTLQAFTYTSAAPVEAIRTAIAQSAQGGVGTCSHNLNNGGGDGTLYECADSVATAPDFSGSPELAVHLLRGRVAVRVLWTGVRGTTLPRDRKARFAVLRPLGEMAMTRYGTP